MQLVAITGGYACWGWCHATGLAPPAAHALPCQLCCLPPSALSPVQANAGSTPGIAEQLRPHPHLSHSSVCVMPALPLSAQAKAGITPDIAERLTACSNELSKGRKKRAISPTGERWRSGVVQAVMLAVGTGCEQGSGLTKGRKKRALSPVCVPHAWALGHAV